MSVVIACRNGAEWLDRQLQSLCAQSVDRWWEVIVADNGSTDGSVSIAQSFSDRIPHLRVLDASERSGQSFARNAGAAVAVGAHLLFVDQDDEVDPGYVRTMARALDADPLVAARMDVDTLNRGWTHATRRPAQAESLGLGLGYLPYAAGCTLGVRRDVFASVGGFDVDMPGAAEDVDLCWRVQERTGCPLVYVPDAVVLYRFRSGWIDLVRQARGHGQAQVQLYVRYRDAGMQRRTAWVAVRFWLGVMRRLIVLHSRDEAARTLWRVAHGVGMLEASIRYRVFYP